MDLNLDIGAGRMSSFADVARAVAAGEAGEDEAAAACEAISGARSAALASLARDVLWRRRISDEEADQLAIEGLRRRYYRVMGGAPYERATRDARPRAYDASGVPAALAGEMDACSMGPTELAAKAGVSRQTVYEYLRGESMPSLPTFCKLCSALGCDPADLLSQAPSGPDGE